MVADERVVVSFDQHSATYKANYAELGQEIRSRCPVAWTEAHGGYWVVTGRDILGDLAKRPDLLSNDHDPRGERRGYQGVAIPSPLGQETRGGFLEMDPPEQLEFRRVLNPYLSPSAIDRWRPLVTDLARACLDEVMESGSIDFVDDLANIVPAVLTMGMLGFPLTDWEFYSEPTHSIVYTPPGSPEYNGVVEQMIFMGVRLAAELERAKESPRPGLLASLVAAQASDPSTFNDDDLLGTLILVISGGFDTTTALTAHALQWLSRHPEQRTRIRDDPSLLDPATEEFLRFTTPAQGGARTIAADCEIGGYRFQESERVWLSYALANRDPVAFPSPDELVIDRSPNRHAAFGLGVHRCIGSNLARMTFKIMVQEVLAGIPDYVIRDGGVVRYEDVGTINGFRHMPATFTPGAPRGDRLEQVICHWQDVLDAEARADDAQRCTTLGGPSSRADQLIDAACERIGSDDFGADTWREGLDVLVGSLNAEAALNEIGVAAMTDQIVGYLANRLEIEQWFSRFPEIDAQQIVAPLFGLGLPRTGSTALSYLLAQDPARRSLRVWEANTPCPPPEAGREGDDPRIAVAQAGIDFTNEMFPDFAGMLPSEANGPQECLLLLALDFRSLIFEGMAYVPAYTRWLMQCDMVPAYRFHQRVLKLLQWRCPPYRWWLRSPAHMLSIDALDAVYPDARFVMTHRDVGKVLPSVCALYGSLTSVLTERLDPLAIGAHSREVWSTGLRRLIDFRDRGNEERFHDLSFEDVQRDPIGEVARLYRELGDDLNEEARRRMQNWWALSSKDRRGPAGHPPDRFGLDPASVAQEFAFYNDRFGVRVG